jgi:hypothetical protein
VDGGRGRAVEGGQWREGSGEPVHKLYDVRHRVALQLEAEVLQAQDDGHLGHGAAEISWCWLHLHVDLAQLVLEKLATGRHHHLVHVDMVVLVGER